MAETINNINNQGIDYPIEDSYARNKINELSDKIDNLSIPKKTSALINDSEFISESDIPTKTSQLVNDSLYITATAIPKNISTFINDANYAKTSQIPQKVSSLVNDMGYAKHSEIPTKLSQLVNDLNLSSGGQSGSVNLANYYTKSETDEKIATAISKIDISNIELDTEATQEDVDYVLGKEE